MFPFVPRVLRGPAGNFFLARVVFAICSTF
jgi:hypothetical protein